MSENPPQLPLFQMALARFAPAPDFIRVRAGLDEEIEEEVLPGYHVKRPPEPIWPHWLPKEPPELLEIDVLGYQRQWILLDEANSCETTFELYPDPNDRNPQPIFVGHELLRTLPSIFDYEDIDAPPPPPRYRFEPVACPHCTGSPVDAMMLLKDNKPARVVFFPSPRYLYLTDVFVMRYNRGCSPW